MRTSRLFTYIPAIVLGLVLGVGVAPAFAVDNLGLFELDYDGDYHANALDDGLGNDGDDWYNIYYGTTNPALIDTTGIVPDIFVPTSDDMIFTGGGSKDELDIDQWLWKKAKPTPDKDNITNAFAAGYLNSLGELVIYFGADRYANNGAADMGFWFFQNDVTIDDPEAAEGGFEQLHKEGDILVLATFTRGGDVSSVYVYEWVDSGGDTSDHLQYLGVFGECGDPAGQDACALSNSNEVDNQAEAASPWPFEPKFGVTGFFPKNTLFEGGINITKLLNGTTPCIASFMAETRSSPSTDAVLKDFVLHKFELCGIEASKFCEATLNSAGDEVTVEFDGTVSNTGAIGFEVDLFDSVITSEFTDVCYFDPQDATPHLCDTEDPVVPAPVFTPPTSTESGSVTFMLESGETVLFNGNYLVSGPISSLDFSDTVTATAYVQSVEVDMAQASATCYETGTPEISVTKTCTPYFEFGNTFRAEITGGAENTGNVKLINVTLVDSVFSASELTIVTDLDGDGIVDSGEPAFDGDLTPGEKLAYKATFVSTSVTSHSNDIIARGENVFDPGTNPGQYDDDTASTSATQCKIAPDPDLSITKDCDSSINGTGVQLVAQGGVVAVEVGNIITVTNTGNEVLDPVTVSDSEIALSTTAAGWDCTTIPNVCVGSLGLSESITFTQKYYPDGGNINGALNNPGNLYFVNEATAQGTGVLSQIDTDEVKDDAACKICPPCPTCP